MKDFIKVIFSDIISGIMRLFYFIPVKQNQVLFTSYSGSQYSCNPRYISEYLQKKYGNKIEIVWLFKDPKQYKYLQAKGIKCVRYNYFSRFWYELTARVSIINSGELYSWVPVRADQLHINTWHGGGYYKLTGGGEIKKNIFEKKRIAMASKNTSYYLSTCKCFTENEIRGDFRYNGKVLNIGYPRNDIFFHSNYKKIKQKVCNYYGINMDCNILMYAPTWRYDGFNESLLPDFEKLKVVVTERFGGDWVILSRMHFCSSYKVKISGIYDANYRPDSPEMQELLAASDILISDYSSCIWDFSFTYRPCILFTPDLDEYTKDRGFGIDIYEWGFPVCKTEMELNEAIKTFDITDFKMKMEKHHKDFGSFEQGSATEQVGKLIYDFCYSNDLVSN